MIRIVSNHEACLKFDIEDLDKVYNSVNPDLISSNRVSFKVSKKDNLQVSIIADSIGSFRGSLNTATKLVKLSKKIIGDFK